MNATVAETKKAPVLATFVCLGVAWLLFLIPFPGAGLFVGWPLNLVAFVLAIVVWQGQVPYRDFFQHHNPLLWYLFAPVTQLFYRDTAIVYAARVAAILGWGAVLYKLYALVCAGFGGRAAGSAGDESGPRAVADAGFSGCRGDAADVGLEADAAAKRMTAQWALLFLLALSPLCRGRTAQALAPRCATGMFLAKTVLLTATLSQVRSTAVD